MPPYRDRHARGGPHRRQLLAICRRRYFAGGLAVLAGGAAIAGATHLYNAGVSSADAKCEAAQVAEQNAQLEARLQERDRQLVFANALQQRRQARRGGRESSPT
ncbi:MULTISPECIES: hypothetical protein [unclassified Bradyrhizobium]|uniref:hypothetical protein n=1 Tax=unclassified Bradyrhizobium TaxID=2631580 RepID=UPI00041C28E8|nr:MULTISPECIES: hypothetical protein [unclassified Bradyrhizobium]QIG91044.1 hypothetical protein G6P99_36725 [Bradyrhizobium sp. 6(2017)]